MENFVQFLFSFLIGGCIGALIARKRTIGAGWGFVLGGFLGIIGWIIAACCKKKNDIDFIDEQNNDEQ